MKNSRNFLLVFLISILTYGCNQKVCPPEQDPETEKFRTFVMSLDGKYKIRSLWIDGIDSSAYFDTLHIRNKVFYTKGYDYYDKYWSTECPLVKNFYYGNNCSKGKYVINQSLYISYSFLVKTLNKQPGFLQISLVGGKIAKRADSTLYQQLDYNRDYFFGINYAFRFANDTISLTTNFRNREIKLLIY